MSRIAVLTIEVSEEVPESQWDTFTAELARLEWELVEPMTATWCGAYEDDVSEEEAVEMVMEDVAAAAEAAQIREFDAAVHFGPNTPSVFSDADYEDVDEDDGGEGPG
jgi:hypothetical protein